MLSVSPNNTACQSLTRNLSLAFIAAELANGRLIGCDRPELAGERKTGTPGPLHAADLGAGNGERR
ncbi:hypothetical protein BOS5A_210118 [Bosea sp. EC-HK365B]|nr:hypothetical protein BOSE46_40568 [Bosea sp. 46]CAD5290969.1 hypothetical protein BOSE21B_80011 [Bosea sp. 21B]CAD5300501.1 hypothetical protein BOSE7B_70019 [Bosea sp. 7B]VVT59327.1 hypothetical protein BOS5A_210118 [Bosea sp. EC-HK365B]VXB06576.1 hypothetical protein BOSE125_110011 [Bosea sp. 125]VXB86732.1 hypothetical protein BOSE127_160012 [Bosea sp. 127]